MHIQITQGLVKGIKMNIDSKAFVYWERLPILFLRFRELVGAAVLACFTISILPGGFTSHLHNFQFLLSCFSCRGPFDNRNVIKSLNNF